MLANNEPLQGVRLAEVFSLMLRELPWPNLKACIQINAQLAKLSTLGGYRLEPKHRSRFENLVLKEAEKAEFSTTFCNPIFAQWYPVHETLYQALEAYFHSDTYKSYRENLKLDEDAYILPAEKFPEFFKIEDLEKWRILLCFSPLQFSPEQAKQILDESQGNDVLLRRLRDLEENLATLRRENLQQQSENERLKAQIESGAAEMVELRQARRDLQAEASELRNKFDSSQNDNRRLRQQVVETEAMLQTRVSEAAAAVRQEKARIEISLQRMERELNDWRTRYEQQRSEDRELKRVLQETEVQLAKEKSAWQEQGRRIEELHHFADLILQRMDWVVAGRKMNMTPSLQRQFNSVIKKLNYEADMSLTIEGSLPTFWDKLMTLEKGLIDQVSQSNTREVMDGAAEEFWMNLKESFDDVIIGLEARLMLLKLLKEIFYQVVDMKALEDAVIPREKPVKGE